MTNEGSRRPVTGRPRILYVLHQYPQVSETYIQTEIDALRPDYDITVVSLTDSDLATEDEHPVVRLDTAEQLLAFARDLAPERIHSHWLSKQLHSAVPVARELGIPYTIRAHSFDTLWNRQPWHRRLFSKRYGRQAQRRFAEYANDELCLGVLCFPFSVPHLFAAGMKREKLHPCPPVIDFERFHDEGPNGDAVLNLGAATPKKNYPDYFELARLVPEVECNLYALGYRTERYRREAAAAGSPVVFRNPVPHSGMPQVYKRHRWLVYTACPKLANVGWPMAVAEAQAAGVGVCLQDVRPDLADYLDGAGILFKDPSELREIVTGPVPEKMRRRGFEVARRSDVRGHRHLLTRLWPTPAERTAAATEPS